MGQEKELARIIKEARLARGYSQRELARLAGVDSGEISRLEAGERPKPRLETLWKIAPYLGMEGPELVKIVYGPERLSEDEEFRLLQERGELKPINRAGKAFGDRLQKLRGEKGITRSKAAAEIGITYHAYSEAERGVIPHSETLCAIADYYGVSIDYLLGRTDVQEVTAVEGRPQLLVYAVDLDAPEGNEIGEWRDFLERLIRMVKLIESPRDREILIDLASKLAGKA